MATMGVRFVPTDQELLRFLRRKLNGVSLRCGDYSLREEQLYRAAPWNLFPDDDPRWVDVSDKRKMLYVFCNPAKVGNSSSNKRISRVAGCGTWLGKSVGQDVKDCSDGRIIGRKRSFSFTPEEGSESEMEGARWILHELCLAEGCSTSEVVCRITKYMPKETSSSSCESDDQRPINCLKRKVVDDSGQYMKKVFTCRSEEEEDSNRRQLMIEEDVNGINCDDLIDISFLDEDDDQSNNIVAAGQDDLSINYQMINSEEEEEEDEEYCIDVDELLSCLSSSSSPPLMLEYDHQSKEEEEEEDYRVAAAAAAPANGFSTIN